MDDRQLRWVHRSRQVETKTAAVGLLAREVVKALGRGGPAWRHRLITLLYDEAGALLDHAAPSSLRKGVLTFRVDEPGLAYTLGLQWEQRLLALIQARLPQAGVHTIRFAAGYER
jgi:hypothetical protein